MFDSAPKSIENLFQDLMFKLFFFWVSKRKGTVQFFALGSETLFVVFWYIFLYLSYMQ